MTIESSKWRRRAAGFILILLAVTAVASFVPLIDSDRGWIRFLDFPRLQLLVALLLLFAGAVLLRRHAGRAGLAVCALGLLALAYQTSKLYPYTALSAYAAAEMARCDPDNAFTVMIANVLKRNENAGEFLDLVAEADPDLLLVMETDDWWDRHLAPLDASFPEKAQYIPDGHGAYGMHLLSKLPLASSEFLFLFDSYTPTAVTEVALPGGDVVQFIGLHPHPPLPWSQPSTLRDGSLLASAMLARSSTSPTIIAGDFNAVPWETVSRRAARIGGLLDPRIGRGFHMSFKMGNLLFSWPLDQILFQQEFGLLEFAVLRDIGSDHFPVLARLCHDPEAARLQAAPDLRAGDLEAAESSMKAARAMNVEGRM